MVQTCKHGTGKAGGEYCQGIEDAISSKLFKALGDPTRIGLLAFLSAKCKPVTVSQAAECCPIDISVVSRHLAVLRDAGVLEVERQGREVYYSVRYSELARALRAAADAIEACCPRQPIAGKD